MSRELTFTRPGFEFLTQLSVRSLPLQRDR